MNRQPIHPIFLSYYNESKAKNTQMNLVKEPRRKQAEPAADVHSFHRPEEQLRTVKLLDYSGSSTQKSCMCDVRVLTSGVDLTTCNSDLGAPRFELNQCSTGKATHSPGAGPRFHSRTSAPSADSPLPRSAARDLLWEASFPDFCVFCFYSLFSSLISHVFCLISS